MSVISKPSTVSRRLRMFRRAVLAATGSLLAAGVVALVSAGGSVARAEAPPAGPGAEVRPFTQKIPGSDTAFDLVPIPGGKFVMGSPESEKTRKPDEGPQFEVSVEPFYMGKFEVTWGEFNEFTRNYSDLGQKGAPPIPADKLADAVTYPTPMYEVEAGPKLQRMGRSDKHPAVIMSAYSARQYTKWLSKKTGRFYRLPTEAEWEYAARAGTKTAYFFGDDPKKLDDYAWFFDNSESQGEAAYREVGQKKPNPWGLYDIYGNVAEYTIDQYDANWYKPFGGKGVSWKDVINWPTQQYPRTVRGGGYESDPDALRSASRFKVTVANNDKDPQLPKSPHWMSNGFWIGFRVVSPVNEPPEAEKNKWWDVDDPDTKRILEKDRADRQIREVVSSPATPGK